MVKSISHQELRELIKKILDGRGVNGSEIISNHFVEAELRGHSSHGVQRVIPLVKGIELGTIRKELKYDIVKENSNSILIDGLHSIGITLWDRLIEEYMEEKNFIAVRNSSHIGFLGYYTEKVARRGKVGIMIGNAEPAVVKPGNPEKILSTTPISISIPMKGNNPIILDMSLASIARGKIIEALRKGEEIPHGVAVDKEGKITTNPKEALEGGILPMGGHKGFYLMLTLELLVSFLTGSAIGPSVKGVLNTESPPNKGEIMIIIDPLDSNYDAISYMKNILKSDLPGEHGMKLRERAMREGIEIDEKLYETLVDMKDKIPYFR